MNLLPAILPVRAAMGAVSKVAHALRPGSGADFAAALQQSLGQRFTTRWDADKNGTVTPDEFPGKPELFAKWDLNKDGSISAAEANAALGQLAEKRRMQAAAQEEWALYDSDRNGALTPAEMGLPKTEFDPLDTNHDRSLNRTEWLAARGVTESGLIR